MSNYTNNLFVPGSENNSWANLYDYIPPGSRVLDIGCSSGNFGEVLVQEKDCEVIGLDMDKPDIVIAKKKLTQAYVRNIEKDSISDLGKFDIIIFADVLEHLLDPIGTLIKVKKSLRTNGKVLFSIPNMSHISIRLNLLRGFFEYTETGLLDRTHLHYYDEQEVLHLFSSAGYGIKIMNPTVYEYPKTTITKALQEAGLKADSKFYDYLAQTQAKVFQFIGVAMVDARAKATKRSPNYIFPRNELVDLINAKEVELSAAKQSLVIAEDALRAIRNSRRWKYASTLADIKLRLSAKARSGKNKISGKG